jgi:serine/threonine-protein kinase
LPSLANQPTSLRAGEPFGRYRLLELIGQGGMAEVYRAIPQGMPGIAREFVVKRMRPDKSLSPKLVQLFIEEARISALLHHPNVVRIYDFGHIDGVYFMVMEHLRGKDLSTVMRALRARRAALSPSLAVFVAREVAHALHHAHTLMLPDGKSGGIVHRDVTPSNIMLLALGGVKILDFGIAKALARAQRPDSGGTPPRLAGKLSYLSPELVRGTPIDHRSDIFSLGVVLWEMLAGHRLFAGDNEAETLSNVLTRPIPAASRCRAGIPAALDDIVARALERDPARRYQTAELFADELDDFLDAMPVADQTIPRLFEDLFGAPRPCRDESAEHPPPSDFEDELLPAPAAPLDEVTASLREVSGPARPATPRVPLLAMLGIFVLVVAVVVTVGRLVLGR